MGVKRSLILIGGNMSDYTPVLTVIPLPGKFANIFTKELGRKRVEDTRARSNTYTETKKQCGKIETFTNGILRNISCEPTNEKKKREGCAFFGIWFCPVLFGCWSSFLTLWKWFFTHVLVSLYSLSQMLNAVPEYKIVFKLEYVFSYQICMLQNATLQW